MKNKKKKNTKETTANKKVSASVSSGSKLGEIKAFTVLSLSRRKLNCLDDEEELFRYNSLKVLVVIQHVNYNHGFPISLLADD